MGGGLSASATAHRLRQFDTTLKILVVEAGPNVNERSDIVWPDSNPLGGSDLDWKYTTVNQPSLDGRSISVPCGRALGGGSAINACLWLLGLTAL